MKKLILATAVTAAAAAPLGAMAQATPEHTVTGNFTLATDYRFRGISQTYGEGFFTPGPAVQGGIDYSHASGFYVGTWASNVSGNQYPNGSSIEMDFYGGYKWAVSPDWTIDIGTIYYAYPGSKFLGPNANGQDFSKTINNWEAYIGASWKFLSVKYYYSFTDYFGLSDDVASIYSNKDGTDTLQTASGKTGNTKGTQYLTAALTYEVMPKLTLGASMGYTWLGQYGSQLNYFDYKVGLTYDWNSWMLGAAIIGTNADKQWWYATNGESKVREIGTVGLVLSVGKTF